MYCSLVYCSLVYCPLTYILFTDILFIVVFSGVEIEGIQGKRTFLEGAGINLTCSHSTSTDMSNKLMFSIPSVTDTNYTKTRSFDGITRLSTLVISKDKVMEGDTGTYTCKFDGSSDEQSVSIEVFRGKLYIVIFSKFREVSKMNSVILLFLDLSRLR